MKESILAVVCSKEAKSAWDKGVKEYAVELVKAMEKEPETQQELKSCLLNGADNWRTYSYGGCALIYDSDIAARLCTPSELKKTRNGELNPNKNEMWLDVQARALEQAANMVSQEYRIFCAEHKSYFEFPKSAKYILYLECGVWKVTTKANYTAWISNARTIHALRAEDLPEALAILINSHYDPDTIYVME